MPNAQDRITGVKSTLLPTPRNFQKKGVGTENKPLEKGPEHAYLAYKFTDEIFPLKDPEGHLITEVTEKATFLFNGTSLIPTNADLGDIPTSLATPDCPPFPDITKHKVSSAIKKLPNKKAAGPDNTPNKLLKIARGAITPHLTIIFNTCLKTHHFPPQWKEALTAIIRKAGKGDYTDPNAYWPIALLNTLGKVFEKIINNRLTYWSKQTNTLHPGHLEENQVKVLTTLSPCSPPGYTHNGRRIRLYWDYSLMSSRHILQCIERLVHSLRKKSCPTYLYLIINSFLTDRTTRLRIDKYISQEFPIPNSLPQGSPLSVTLYLLLPTRPPLDNDAISIAYIDNVTHLVAKPTADQGMKSLEATFQHSEDWRKQHGAIFDPKKAKAIAFTKRKMNQPSIQLGNQLLDFEKKVKWLGITLTPTLTPGEHLKNLKKCFNDTLAQLTRISRPTFRLNQKESRQLILAVLLTWILHGSILWFTMKNKTGVNKLLDTWHHRATRLSMGMMRQTPIAFIKHFGNIPDFTNQHITTST
ncbi:hypothetical protein O181_037856 [Austropuccinia psidii MF-1]|uniref:Reverse transcriptase domain-containing protein n=1 Tax=Austropuccinia psidii MF-1 TaxID=1389203 RepID=A0A9Q3DCY0_9BASI|nr:hypothetical protein [Austropuccinia psidii MF-1]